MRYDTASYLLPTGEGMNPAKPQDAEYFDEGQVAYIVRSEKGTFRCLTSFGALGTEWAIGSRHEIRHDQTHRSLGFFRVVGIANFTEGTVEGVVPAKKIPHWVFK